MRGRQILAAVVFLALVGVAFAQRSRMFFPFEEDDEVATPPDAADKTEFVFARLQYPAYRSNDRRWMMRGMWSIDYPKADRQFVQGVRRLTRLNIRSVEQVVHMRDDNLMNYPWTYVVEPGHWDLPDDQAAKLREYLLKGGFLITDDFHGSFEWEIFMASMRRVFPDRPVVDLPNDHPIFHVLYDLDDRFQIPGIVNYPFDQTYEYDGVQANWRGIFDEKGRLMVAICHNMDMGDAWEWADSPHYPERYASLAYRIGINYIMYAMSH